VLALTGVVPVSVAPAGVVSTTLTGALEVVVVPDAS
jgi:hypothetical protein